MRAALSKSFSLGGAATLDIATPFLRMAMLSRALSLSELGFASALATAYILYECVTDIAIHRYVYAQERSHFARALAGAQGLLLLRALVLCVAGLAFAPVAASVFSLQGEAADFAALAGPLLIRGFENLEPKIAERDFAFAPQFRVALFGSLLSLAALAAALSCNFGHQALTASLYGLVLGQVAASHFCAQNPWRISLTSPEFRAALRYGAPLALNGIGIAFASQGDRLLVGALLGVEALGRYAVAMLAVIVPVSLLLRLFNALASATLYNAGQDAANLRARPLRALAQAAPLAAALYACAALALAGPSISLVFGARFAPEAPVLALLAGAAFFRIARGEPFTALLLLEGRTGKAALIGLAAPIGLLIAAGLMLWRPSVEAALAGRCLGEVFALALGYSLANPLLGAARKDFLRVMALAAALTLAAGLCLLAGAPALAGLAPIGLIASAFALRGDARIFRAKAT